MSHAKYLIWRSSYKFSLKYLGNAVKKHSSFSDCTVCPSGALFGKMLSDEEIRELWKNPDNNPAAFTGLMTYLHYLKHEKGMNISMKKLKKIMSQESTLLQNSLKIQRFPRRPYYVHG